MGGLQLYEMVRVVKIKRPPEEYDPWDLNRHPPCVGDTGYLIELLRSEGAADHYVVEKSRPSDGANIWLSEFEKDEIEALE